MNSQPSRKQKVWRECVREIGSIVSGGPAVIHHPVGRTGKHNKIEIGHWWVLPLTDGEHKALHANCEELLGDISGYLMTRKEFEKWAYKEVLKRVEVPDECFPPDEVIDAILEYRR